MKVKKLLSTVLAFALVITAVNVPSTQKVVKADSIDAKPEEITAHYNYVAGEAWTLIPQDFVVSPNKVWTTTYNDKTEVGFKLEPTVETVFRVSTKDSRYNNLIVGGMYNGTSFTITGIDIAGDRKSDVLYIPDKVYLVKDITAPYGKEPEDGDREEYKTTLDTGLKYYTSKAGSSNELVEKSLSATFKGYTPEGSSVTTNTIECNVAKLDSNFTQMDKNSKVEFAAYSIPKLNESDPFGNNAFNGNQSIVEVDLSRYNGVTLKGTGVFSNCQKLQTVILNNALHQLPADTFNSCFLLRDIKISQITSIGEDCFNNCHALSAPNISGEVQTIEKGTFANTKISEINLLKTNITSVEANAFGSCPNLRRVFLGKSITSFEDDSFPYANNSLDYIYLDAPESQFPKFVDKSAYKNKFVSKDTEGPVLLTAEATSLGGTFPNNSITKASVVYIYDAVDVDVDNIKIYKDDMDVTSQVNLVCDTESVNKVGHNTRGAHFDINEMGIYKVVSSDVLGNTSTRYIYFQADFGDTQAPKIKLNDEEIANGTTKKVMIDTAVISVSDDVAVDEFKINGAKIGINTYAVTVGEYDVTVKDRAGNTTTCKIIIGGVDKEAPVVTGVSNNGIYNKAVTIKIKDDSKYTVKGSAVTKGTYDEAKGTIEVNKTGSYELTVTDECKNETTLKFTIDLDLPSVNGVSDGEAYRSKKTIKVRDNLGIKSATINGNAIPEDGVTVATNGKYVVTATDLAGNTKTVTFWYDTKAPSISGVKEDGVYKKSAKVKISDDISGIEKIELDGEQVDFKPVITVSGTKKHSLTVYDKAGNKKQVRFSTDAKKPKISASKKAKVGDTIRVSDTIALKYVKVGKKKYNCSGKTKFSCKFTKKGKQKITVVDKAGNKATKTVKVKKKKK